MIVSNFDKRLAARLAKNLYQVLVQSLVYIFSTSSITFLTVYGSNSFCFFENSALVTSLTS
jgi:hypothetical protein